MLISPFHSVNCLNNKDIQKMCTTGVQIYIDCFSTYANIEETECLILWCHIFSKLNCDVIATIRQTRISFYC
jgi:hypothetical protein